MKTHIIASIEALEYHSSQYARLTAVVLEQKFILWTEMKLSKSTYGFGSKPFLFTIETKTRPNGEQIHMVETIQPWKAPTEEKPALPPPVLTQKTGTSARKHQTK